MKKDLTLEDIVGLTAVAVLGRSVAKTAYLMAHPDTNCTEASLAVSISRWLNNEKSQEHIQTVKAGRAKVMAESTDTDKGNDLTTRQGIVSELITSVKATSGKDSVNALQTLAKIQGLDRPEERPDDERRRFVLTWPSHCRTCALMRLYISLKNENKIV